MEKQPYEKIISMIPEKFKKDIVDSLSLKLKYITTSDIIKTCNELLSYKKLYLRRLVLNCYKEEDLEEEKNEIKELEELILKLNDEIAE